MGRQAQEEGSQHGTAHAEGSGQESPRRVCSWRRPLGLEHRVYRGPGRSGGLSCHPEGLAFPLSVSRTSQVFTRPFGLRG